MKTFKDLEFDKTYNGVGAHYKFDNGITISVQAGAGNYSTPKENLISPNSYSSFEVGLWDEKGKWITQDFAKTDNLVAGWQTKEDIDAIIMAVNNF